MVAALATGDAMVCTSISRQQRGAVLLTVLLFVLITTLGASSLVQVYQTQTRREKEQQLLFVGDQYRRAIAAYYNIIPPGGARAMPKTLADLLDDQRFATPVHHLRRAYPDPMTGNADWTLVTDRGGISGVRSQSTQAPIKTSGFPDRYKNFEGQATYAGWAFVVAVQ
jgi:type II secretory pathway pseudopilin PulG